LASLSLQPKVGPIFPELIKFIPFHFLNRVLILLCQAIFILLHVGFEHKQLVDHLLQATQLLSGLNISSLHSSRLGKLLLLHLRQLVVRFLQFAYRQLWSAHVTLVEHRGGDRACR
jgi:hypothetical protein